MLLKYSQDFSDIKFAFVKIYPDIKTEKIDSNIELHAEEVFQGLDNVLDFILKNGDKYSVKDIKRIRSTLEKVPIDGSFASYISLYNSVVDLLLKTNLKNIQYVEDMVKEYKCQYMFFNLLKIQVGKIVSMEEVEGSDNLYVEQVDIGEKTQIVSGIRKLYSKEDLINKKVLFITNIKKSKIKNNESNGMILCGKEDEKVEVLFVDDSIKVGEIAYLKDFDLFSHIPVGIIDLKKTFYKNLFDKLRIINGCLVFDGICVEVGGQRVKSNFKDGIVG